MVGMPTLVAADGSDAGQWAALFSGDDLSSGCAWKQNRKLTLSVRSVHDNWRLLAANAAT